MWGRERDNVSAPSFLSRHPAAPAVSVNVSVSVSASARAQTVSSPFAFRIVVTAELRTEALRTLPLTQTVRRANFPRFGTASELLDYSECTDQGARLPLRCRQDCTNYMRSQGTMFQNKRLRNGLGFLGACPAQDRYRVQSSRIISGAFFRDRQGERGKGGRQCQQAPSRWGLISRLRIRKL